MNKPIQKHILLAAFAALLPAGLSAQNTTIIGFNTDGNIEGFTGYSSSTAVFTNPVVASGGFLTGTSPGGDPRLVKTSTTAFFSKPAAAAWTTVRFRVRETNETPAVVTPWSNTGINLVLNGTTSPTTGAVTISSSSCTAVDDGDGFFIVTADISAFTANEVKYFRFDPIGGADAAGNFFEVDWVEITRTNTLPALVTTSPVDGVTDVAPADTLTATFDEPIFLNTTGSVTIKNLTTATDTVISLPGPDTDGVLSVNGSVLTIDPTADLGVPGDELAIEISADAIKDVDGGFYAGILSSDVPNWSFTIDNLPPVPEYFHPIPATANAPLDGALFIGFDENVVKGTTGNLVIHKADNSIVETIAVTSSNVTVNGSRVAIIPTVPLAYGTSYYVLIDNGAFTDALGNDYGLADSAIWAFSTITNEATILFGDSFNREDGNDLDASTRGKYGSLGALNYTQRILGPGSVANVELTSGQLLLESNENDGNAGALIYPEHNFTDAAITAAGGFSITVDLNQFLSGGSRFMTVAMGQTSADLDDQTSASPAGSEGDLAVAYRRTTTSGNPGLFIYKNGTLVSGESVSTDLPPTPTKMRIDCTMADFNADSEVNYSVFFDDSVTPFTSGTFTWSGADENHISLSSNLLQTFTVGERHALFDNLQIRTLGGGSSGFDTWKTTNNAVGQGLDDDHDFDGVTNGIEYFIGGPSGNTTGFTLLPGVVPSGGNRSVTFVKAGDYTGGYEVQVSPSLATGSWSPATISLDPNIPGTVHISGNNVTYTFPAGTKNFARLAVTGP